MWIDENEQTQNNQLNQPNNQSVGAGGGSVAQPSGTTGNPSTVTPVQSNQPQPKFAGIQDYLKGNQQQGETLGQKFTSKLADTQNTEKNTIANAAAGVTNDVTANQFNYDPNLTAKAVSNPTEVANDPNQYNAFLKQWNASYGGPESFEASDSYTPAVTAANEANEKAAQLKTTGGRQQLLQDQFGKTSQGNRGLDAAILQQSSAFPEVQTKAKEFGTVQDYLNQQAGNVNTQIAGAKTAADTAKTNTQNAFTGALSGLQSSLADKVKAAQDTATAQTTAYTDALKSGDATKINDALKNSNLTDAQKTNLIDYLTEINKSYGANPDLSNTFSFNPKSDVNTANVASAEDYAKAQALQKLTGVDYGGVLNPADAAKAGTAANPTVGLNAETMDKNLRQYLIQQEIAKLRGGATTPGGSSTPAQNDNKGKETAAVVGTMLSPLGLGLTGAFGAGVSKVGNKIASSLGMGKGKGDASVNLPGMNIPEMAIPKTANAATTKAIVDVFNKPLNTQGSYQEGAVYDVVNRLGVLKDAASKGQISPDEYTAYAKPLAQWAKQATQTIMGASSQAANSVKDGYYNLVNNYSDLLK